MEIRPVPVEYARSPDWAYFYFFGCPYDRNSGFAKAPATYSRIASLPATGGASSSLQNGRVRSKSCAYDAASQFASAKRMAVFFIATLTRGCIEQPAMITANTAAQTREKAFFHMANFLRRDLSVSAAPAVLSSSAILQRPPWPNCLAARPASPIRPFSSRRGTGSPSPRHPAAFCSAPGSRPAGWKLSANQSP